MFIKEKPEKIWETAALKNGLGIRLVDSSQGRSRKKKRQYRSIAERYQEKDSGGKKPASAPQCDDSGGGTEKGSASVRRKDI